ncbi:MAG: LLM class flavin-dependent oxidoreductase, partial [Comamonadaceae bacterium]
NTPKAFAPAAQKLIEATAATGRHVTTYVLVMVVAAETDEAAHARWEHYKAGIDHEAIAWMGQQGAADTRSGTDTNVRQMTDTTSPSAVNINMGTLVGSWASVARMLDEMAEVPGTEGVLLTFDDFVQGVEAFGEHIQPLMHSRTDAVSPVPSRVADEALAA